MEQGFELSIEYSDSKADWDTFIKMMVDKFHKWEEETASAGQEYDH